MDVHLDPQHADQRPCRCFSFTHVCLSLHVLTACLPQETVQTILRAVWAHSRPWLEASRTTTGGMEPSSADLFEDMPESEAEPEPGNRPRIWDAPRGPPPLIPVNETREQREHRESQRRILGALFFRVSGAVADALRRAGYETEVTLTDIDPAALQSLYSLRP